MSALSPFSELTVQATSELLPLHPQARCCAGRGRGNKLAAGGTRKPKQKLAICAKSNARSYFALSPLTLFFQPMRAAVAVHHTGPNMLHGAVRGRLL